MPDTTQDRKVTTAEALYNKSKKQRRLIFLELMAHAITRAEKDGVTSEFRQKLEQHRIDTWGKRPWAGAVDEGDFLAHVEAMARAFTGDGAESAWYPNRKHGPLPGMDR